MEAKELEVLEIIKKFDIDTYNHCSRTYDLCTILGKEVGCNMDLLKSASLIHDIGKIFIPMDILGKKGPLNKEERGLVDLHAYLGYRYLHSQGINEDVCRIVLYHHGYYKPLNECVDKVSVSKEVRDCVMVLRTSDVFDALSSNRPYRKAMDKATALKTLKTEVTNPDVNISLINCLSCLNL